MIWSVGRRFALLIVALASAALVAGMPGRAQDRILVFAAASLKSALDEVAAAWQRESGQAAIVSYGATSALARQVEQGAPADVFVSADRDWMDYLAERNLLRPGTRVDLLSNRLVLIAPIGGEQKAVLGPGLDLAALLGNGRLAVADARAVPAGKYAKAALESLGLWSAVANRLAQTEHVQAALALVARGEAPLGIVYETDAKPEARVAVLGTFPPETHPPIVYPAAILARNKNPAAADLMQFLRSAAAKQIFRSHGFIVLD